MSIRRRKKLQQFTQISNAALRNPVLSLKAKGLLAVMMSCPEDWQFYMEWLEQQSRDGREAHQSAMKELQTYGYVVRERAQGKDGKFSGWDYLVDDEIQIEAIAHSDPTNGKAVSRFTDERENRRTGKPSDGKPAASNTDFTKKDLTKSGVITMEGDARAKPPAAPSQIRTRQDEQAPSSSLKNASLQNRTAGQQKTKAVALLEKPAASPTAADAASEVVAFTDQDFDELLGGGDVSDQALPKVAGGAAAVSPVAASQVAALVSVPRSVLMARPVAPVGSETYKGIKAMVGKHKLDELLGEITVTGGYSRQDWLRLLPEEIALVREAARSEARQHGGSMVTFAARGLDRMIGAVASQKPQQQALQANGAAYVVRVRTEPEPEAPSEGKYEAGARYRSKAGGAEVQLIGLETVKSKITGGGARYRLSDGQVMGMLELIGKFDFVGR